GPLAPFVRLTTGSGVVESYGDLTYPLFAANTAQVRVRAARLAPDQVIPVLTSRGNFSSRESWAPTAGFYTYDRPLPLNLPRNERRFVPIPLSAIEPDGHGFLFLQLDTYAVDEWARYPKVFLQLTELGLSAKFSPENNVIWVSFLKSGQPAPGADVEIRDDGNRVLWKGQAGPDGRVETPGWKALGLRPENDWSKPRQWVIARLGEDAVLTASDESEGVEPYRFDLNFDWNPEPERYQGTIYSERGIYRAGETVHLKGILREREKGAWKIPVLRDVDLEILDPFQKSVFKAKAVLDDYGSFAVDYESREDAPLGTYDVSAVIPAVKGGRAETRIGESFRLEAFRTAEFEVHLKSLRDAYVFGEPFEAEIRSAYLFGGVLSGQKASWSLRLSPTSFSPPGHPGYVFGRDIDFWDDEEPGEQSRLVGSGDAVLDKDGKTAVKIPLVAGKERGPMTAGLEATVQSPSRRSISNRIQTVVHPGEFYIGLNPSAGFLKKGDPLSVQVVAALPDGTLQSGRSIDVKLVKRVWTSVRKAGLGGRLEWISEKADTMVAAQNVKTAGPDPATVRFQPEQSGFYLIQAEARDDARREISTSTYVYVTGNDYVAWERRDDDAIDLVADADSYKPGETARILVKSPYEKAKALVTVEREFILKSEVVEIAGTTTEIAVPITADLIPNAFVSVLLIQGRTSAASSEAAADAGKPSFKIGYIDLPVDPAEKRLGLEIKTDRPAYRPGDEVEIRLRASDAHAKSAAGSLAVAVVDVGVLNLIGYQTPDPFAAFYGERPLSVETAETRVHVVGQRHFGEKGENPGGGGAEKGAGLSLSEVQLRGNFKSTAYWNPSIPTDADGRAVVKFKLPDNLTTFRIMAVAQTRDSRFGRNAADFKVRKPLLLLPALPRFARVGDVFDGGVLLTNNTDAAGTIRISLQASGLQTKDLSERTVDLSPGASREILYAFKAEDAGQAKLGFRAVMNGESDGLEAVIPIDRPRPLVTLGFSGRTETNREETVRIPPDIFPDIGEIETRASASALTGLRARLDELAEYPYLCLEQRLSRILPFLVAGPVIRDFKLSALTAGDIEKMLRDNLREIYACQKDNGGFSLWPDSAFDSPYVSAYAVFALLKAYDAGVPIDKARLDSGLDYLRNILRSKYDALAYPYRMNEWSTVQVFALYDLALARRAEAAYAENLFQKRETLPLFGRALLLKTLPLAGAGRETTETLIREFFNMAKITAADAHFEDNDPAGCPWIYSSAARTTAIVLQALLETGQSGPVLDGAARWLALKKSGPGWASPQENFFVFYALNEYYRRVEKTPPDFRARIRLAEKTLLEESFREPQAEFRAAVPLSAFDRDRNLLFRAEKNGSGSLSYSLRMSYAPRKPLPPTDEGFAVFKKIESLDGRPLTDIPGGSMAVVTLEIAVPKESLFVVVEDPLPAGFEAVNTSFRTESEERQMILDALDRSDDRPWWDGWNHVEKRDDRVLLFADSLLPGVHRYRYLVRALTFGAFGAPGPVVQQMYAPEIYGRGSEQTVRIVK
ncbi:MAG: alpha-2-macroglobulin family protein, partial [Candidatus Aminicenantales bacterium]